MPVGRLIGFAIVWVALALLVAESAIAAQRGSRRAALRPVRITNG
jgi:hypothetical protein